MSTAPAAPAIAAVVGRYRMGRRIGGGEHGEVFVARAADGAPVALKRLRPPPGDAARRADVARRFIAEVETARRLRHPDIVRIVDADVDASGPWLAMELLAGCSLERYTRPARLLPEPVVVAVAERIARALAHAHAQGVVHRDLKPSNVVVDWATRRVTLTDFGLARVVGPGAGAGGDASRTRTGVVLGTPGYMAPEQLAGAAADGRADLYALGVTLFELLAGRRPHAGGSLGELLRAVALQPAPELRALRPALPAELAALVARLLAKRPAERPAGAGTVADALAAVGAAMQAAAPRPMSRP